MFLGIAIYIRHSGIRNNNYVRSHDIDVETFASIFRDSAQASQLSMVSIVEYLPVALAKRSVAISNS